MATVKLENKETNSTPGYDTHFKANGKHCQVNVFFDGTLNNYYNVTAKEEVKAEHAKEASYADALSNIGRMWDGIKDLKLDHVLAVYIDGIGSTRYKDDTKLGYAFGMGDTGVKGRAKEAFYSVGQELNRKYDEKIPPFIHFNVFGFSRGAATARRFVHLITTTPRKEWPDLLQKKVALFDVNFVGLFDTVASEGYEYDDDVATLSLQLAPDSVGKVFHLVAGDEYRARFSLTTIDSVLSDSEEPGGKGYELIIPGAHADVGGSYHDTLEESFTTDNKFSEKSLINFIHDQGWYLPEESHEFRKSGNNRSGYVTGCTMRRTITSDYYKIGLTLMVDKTQPWCLLPFPPELTAPSSHEPIETLRGKLRAIAQEEQRKQYNLETELGKDEARKFRHNYLHMSFKDYADLAYAINRVGTTFQRHRFRG